MAKSLHMQIRDAAMAAIGTMTNVQRGRAWPFAEQDASLVKVYLDQSNMTQLTNSGMPNDWSTRLRLEFHARGDDAADGEAKADALMVQGHQLLMVDPSLGGLTMDLQPVGLAWVTDEANTSIGIVHLVLEAQHRTPSASLAAP
jgi:hypothetical protein